jgi:hypothetical protein
MASKTVVITDFVNGLPGRISDDMMRYEFPSVRSVGKKKHDMQWKISVGAKKGNTDIPVDPVWLNNDKMEVGIIAVIRVESGIVGGKIRDTAPTFVSSGKNIGRSNETNVFCQALRDANSKYNIQNKRTSSAGTKMGTVVKYPPMLAKVYTEQMLTDADFEEGVFVQRKYNGVRAVITLDSVDDNTEVKWGEEYDPAKTKVIMYSRMLHLYLPWNTLFEDIKMTLDTYASEGVQLFIDGEIYAHGVELQEISGDARKGNYHPKYKFMAYDCFTAQDPNAVTSTRLDMLEDAVDGIDEIELAPTETAKSIEEINTIYKQYLREDYEGAIVRTNSPYVYSYNSYHSSHLLKYKPSFDGEYEITGFCQGTKGKAVGLLMMICKTENGEIFNVTPALPAKDRKALYNLFGSVAPGEDKDTVFDKYYLGEYLVVTYDEESKSMVPLRARTKLLLRNISTGEYYTPEKSILEDMKLHADDDEEEEEETEE